MDSLVFDIVKTSLVQFLYAVSTIIVCGLILGVMEKKSNQLMQRTFGWRGILITALIGTPIHEIGHLIMCVIFRHDVKEVKLLRLKESKKDGVLGYVRHSFNPKSIYQKVGNFFIAIGPLILGALAIMGSMKLIMGKMYETFYEFVLNEHSHMNGFDLNFITALKNIFLKLISDVFDKGNLTNLNFWIFIFIVISIASHMALSNADMKGAIGGLISIYLIFLFLTIVSKLSMLNVSYIYEKISMINTFVAVLLFIAISFSLMTLIINTILYSIKKILT